MVPVLIQFFGFLLLWPFEIAASLPERVWLASLQIFDGAQRRPQTAFREDFPQLSRLQCFRAIAHGKALGGLDGLNSIMQSGSDLCDVINPGRPWFISNRLIPFTEGLG